MPEEHTDAMLHPIIENRYSPKGFIDTPVETQKLISILEAARWAPSSRNEQPWRFIVETKASDAGYKKLLSTLNEANQTWASQAPVLIAGVTKMFYDRDHRPNRVAMYDIGGAVANLTAQAVSLGLQVHQMGGYNIERLIALYGVPDGYQPAVVLAIGYADDNRASGKRRERLPLSELVFQGNWGNSAEALFLTPSIAGGR